MLIEDIIFLGLIFAGAIALVVIFERETRKED